MIYAKRRNPDCFHKSIGLPTSGIERYRRATQPLISEAVAGVVQDNNTLRRIANESSPGPVLTAQSGVLSEKTSTIRQHYFKVIPASFDSFLYFSNSNLLNFARSVGPR